jgi:hypothetical protein
MIRFNCKTCNQRYKTDDDLAGDEIECQKCGTTVNVPALMPPNEEITLKLRAPGIQMKKAEGLSLAPQTPGKAEGLKPPAPAFQAKKPEGLKPSTPSFGAKKAEGVKMPTLTLPDSIKKKMMSQEVGLASS